MCCKVILLVRPSFSPSFSVKWPFCCDLICENGPWTIWLKRKTPFHRFWIHSCSLLLLSSSAWGIFQFWWPINYSMVIFELRIVLQKCANSKTVVIQHENDSMIAYCQRLMVFKACITTYDFTDMGRIAYMCYLNCRKKPSYKMFENQNWMCANRLKFYPKICNIKKLVNIWWMCILSNIILWFLKTSIYCDVEVWFIEFLDESEEVVDSNPAVYVQQICNSYQPHLASV